MYSAPGQSRVFAKEAMTQSDIDKKEIEEINTLFVRAEALYAEGRYKDARILYEKIDKMIQARKKRREPSWLDIIMGTEKPGEIKTAKAEEAKKPEKAEKEPMLQFLDLTRWDEKKKLKGTPEEVPVLAQVPAAVAAPPVPKPKPESAVELPPPPEKERSWFDILTFKKEKTPEELAREAEIAAEKRARLEQIKAEKLAIEAAREKETARIKAEKEALKEARGAEKRAIIEAKKAEKLAKIEEKRRAKEIAEAKKRAEALARKNAILKRKQEEKMAREARRKIEEAKREKARARAARERVLRAKFMKAYGLPPEPGTEQNE